MRKINQNKWIIGLILMVLFPYLIPAQQEVNSNTTTLEKAYRAYFKEARKSIHLHLNKTTFASGEHIWFSSYMHNTKTNSISLDEAYIYVDLLDDKGKRIASKTIRYIEGFGKGEFLIDPKFNSGNYFLQAYTHPMNGYKEDDSSVYPIEIINFDQGRAGYQTSSPKASDLLIDLQPEGNAYVKNVFSTFGVSVSTVANGMVVPDSMILESYGSTQQDKKILINKMGVGKFSLVPKKGTRHIVKTYYKDSIIISPLPTPKATGYAIAVDHNHEKQQLLVTIATNGQTKTTNKLSLLVHKDGSIFNLPIAIGSDFKQNLVIPYNELYSGVNTLTLIQGDTILSERMVFHQPFSKRLSSKVLNTTKTNDSIIVYVKNTISKNTRNLHKASISILPGETKTSTTPKDIATSFLLNWHFSRELLPYAQQLLNQNTAASRHELDLLLILNGKSRYDWNTIKNAKDRLKLGTTEVASVTGYVNIFDTDNDSLQVMLYSTENGIFETTFLNDKKEFSFDQLSLAKDSKISFTLLNKEGKPVYANFFFTVQPIKNPFKHPYQPKVAKQGERPTEVDENTTVLFKDIQQLDEVVVTDKKLKYEKFFGKFNGRKVDSTMRAYQTLGDYIRSFGYQQSFTNPLASDVRRAGTLQYHNTCRNKFGQRVKLYPSIVFNGVFSIYIMDYAFISMEHIDEIYAVRKQGVLQCSDGGIFIVFTKPSYNNPITQEKHKNSKDFTIANGHDTPKNFIRPDYYTLENDAFKQYGVVAWVPEIVSNEQGVISFKIPDDGQKQLKLHLEGFGANGKYLSNILTLDLE